MYWLILALSGVLEAVWATALGKSVGFTKLWPTVVFGVAIILSMGGLGFAMREIPIGTAYAVWVGIGATLTVAYAMIFGNEPRILGQGSATARARGVRSRAQGRRFGAVISPVGQAEFYFGLAASGSLTVGDENASTPKVGSFLG